MEETSFFQAAITEVYGQSPLALTGLRKHNPEGKQLYRVDFTTGPSWVLRAYHEEHSLTDAFHFVSGSQSLLEWLQGTAHTLSFVTNLGCPAPTIIPSLTGELVGTHQKWHMFMTTFVEGDARDTSPEKMATLGAALGHLHTLSLPEQSSMDSTFAFSWWSRTRLQEGSSRLRSAAPYVPQEMQALYDACQHTFDYFQHDSLLPQTLIHGDCWAENGVQTQEGLATLIDWECAGLGLPILDFGSLLLHCHFDQRDKLEHQAYPQYRPDPQRIAAVVQGYSRWRRISTYEREALLEAVRFSVAWRLAWFFSLLEKDTTNEWVQSALRRWQRWYAISEDIARLGHKNIGQIS